MCERHNLNLSQEKNGQLQFCLEQEKIPEQTAVENQETKGQNKERQKKMEQLDLALDKIKNKYGEESVGRAGAFFLEK